jgi:hypothetical protein
MIEGVLAQHGDVKITNIKSNWTDWIEVDTETFRDRYPTYEDFFRHYGGVWTQDADLSTVILSPFGNQPMSEKVPNQPPLRMPVSGTPAAAAPVAPPPGIAGR